MVNFKLISLNVLCTSKMLREKITEKSLTFISSIPESEETTQTVVCHVFRTRCIQRAWCEMLFCIYKDWFWFSKGMVAGWPVCWHRHYLETLDQLFSLDAVELQCLWGFWAGLSVPLGLCPSEKHHADSLTAPLLMGTVPLPWERVCRHGSLVNKARVLGRKVSL